MLKSKVVMTSVFGAGLDENGNVTVAKHEAIDYVPVDDLNEYVDSARTRWQSVQVFDPTETD